VLDSAIHRCIHNVTMFFVFPIESKKKGFCARISFAVALWPPSGERERGTEGLHGHTFIVIIILLLFFSTPEMPHQFFFVCQNICLSCCSLSRKEWGVLGSVSITQTDSEASMMKRAGDFRYAQKACREREEILILQLFKVQYHKFQ
jgi:hypothetical protein